LAAVPISPAAERIAGRVSKLLSVDLLRTPGRFELLVKNPEPIGTDPLWGNGSSNKAHLLVNYKQ